MDERDDTALLLASLKKGYLAATAAVKDLNTRLTEADAAIARVRQLHSEIPYKRGSCYCANPWPCPTIRALDEQEPDRG